MVSTVAGASADRFPVLIAGIASGLAGVFSMAAGEYMSSKSQHEIFEAQIVGEREEVTERPGEAEAEMAYMFEEDGLPRRRRRHGPQHCPAPAVLLKTMVEKELGLTHRLAEGSPLQGALIMGATFGLGAPVPVSPTCSCRSRPRSGRAVVATAGVLFAIGVVKSRWTRRLAGSGAEILLLGAVAGIAGFLFGDILPGLLGVQPLGA